MFTTLRKFTVIFLAILQLIAPLVHAHAGGNSSLLPDSGERILHVPGLEMLSAGHDASKSPQCNAAMHDFNAYGILIGINAGIKDRQADVGANSDSSYFLPQQAIIFKIGLSVLDTNPFTQPQQFVGRLLIPSLSPRAPPAQLS